MVTTAYPELRAEREQVTRDALARHFEDQRFDVLVARKVLGPEWDRLLSDLVFDLNMATATAVGDLVAAGLPAPDGFVPAFMANWLRVNADLGSAAINGSTRDALDEATDDDGKSAVFAGLVTVSAARYATSMVTTAAGFGAHDAAETAGGKTKTWGWSGKGPRHQGMSGETVRLSQNFSNGQAWPGDPSGGPDEVAGCKCTVTFG